MDSSDKQDGTQTHQRQKQIKTCHHAGTYPGHASFIYYSKLLFQGAIRHSKITKYLKLLFFGATFEFKTRGKYGGSPTISPSQQQIAHQVSFSLIMIIRWRAHTVHWGAMIRTNWAPWRTMAHNMSHITHPPSPPSHHCYWWGIMTLRVLILRDWRVERGLMGLQGPPSATGNAQKLSTGIGCWLKGIRESDQSAGSTAFQAGRVRLRSRNEGGQRAWQASMMCRLIA